MTRRVSDESDPYQLIYIIYIDDIYFSIIFISIIQLFQFKLSNHFNFNYFSDFKSKVLDIVSGASVFVPDYRPVLFKSTVESKKELKSRKKFVLCKNAVRLSSPPTQPGQISNSRSR